MALTRLRDVSALDAFLNDLTLFLRKPVCAWLPAHAASCFGSKPPPQSDNFMIKRNSCS